MFEAADFGEEVVVKDTDIGAFEAGGGEDVNDAVVRNDGGGDELADGGVDFFGRACVFGGFLGQGGANGLEEGDMVVGGRFFANCVNLKLLEVSLPFLGLALYVCLSC